MNPRDPNVRLVEVVAQALGELCDELVFVGGCADTQIKKAARWSQKSFQLADISGYSNS